jgi:putative spermidine/putrescine transport system permease protein
MARRRDGILLKAAVLFVILFLHIPFLIIVLYAFNGDRGQSWPITNWTTQWFAAALDNPGLRDAVVLSVEAAVGATVIAVMLGTLASFAVHRFRFFGRETISFVLVLPLALPGIVTGMALNATINVAGFPFGLFTIIAGHATFCVVVVYNNAIARLRRGSRSLDEASADLGASPVQTFRHITVPLLRGALFAGALLAFALSFDEVIVTTFTAGTQATLPIWILDHLRLPNERPIVNVVAVLIVVVMTIPIFIAQRLSGEDGASLT